MDSSTYEFYEEKGDSDPKNYTLDATTLGMYADGDLLLFGPVQPKSLKEIDYSPKFPPGFKTWAAWFGF